MKTKLLYAGAAMTVAALAGTAACAGSAQPPAHPAPLAATAPLPHAITLRPEALAHTKARIAANDPALQPALARLLRDADRALATPPVAVTDKKTLLPPSNDPHDYFSLSPYWWPDPAKPDGLPYIRRDGETNPESKRDLDQPRVAQMGAAAQTLALAWYFTGDAKYAEGAARQLRTWFLDPATRMNPHLRFSQLVRGNPEERGSGIIDTRWFIEAVDAASILEGSRAWTSQDRDALRAWTRQYEQWLLTSPNGKHEHAAKNNHGSWYAAQVMALAIYSGDTATARALAAELPARIGWQFTPQGEQPTELERTRSYHYSGFNLEALSRAAEVARVLGVDVWRYEAPTGGSLRKGLDNIARYLPAPATWPGKQIDAVDVADLALILRRADLAYGEPLYLPMLGRLDAALASHRAVLLYPELHR